MGYWGKHPMAGDDPMDIKLEIEDYLAEKERIIDIENCFWIFNSSYEQRKNIIEKNKYNLINNIALIIEKEYKRFPLVFMFLDYNIRIRNEYLKDLEDMLTDGGSYERGYDYDYDEPKIEDNEISSPYDVILIIKKYFRILFSESCTNEDIKNKIPKDELNIIFTQNLLKTIFEN